jgi:hypothetical protein
MRLLFPLSLFLIFQLTTPIRIPQSHIQLQLPDDNWHPSAETDTAHGINFFKRNPVTDAKGRQIIPAIMVFVEDAKKYNGDIVTFSGVKRAPFMKQDLGRKYEDELMAVVRSIREI